MNIEQFLEKLRELKNAGFTRHPYYDQMIRLQSPERKCDCCILCPISALYVKETGKYTQMSNLTEVLKFFNLLDNDAYEIIRASDLCFNYDMKLRDQIIETIS